MKVSADVEDEALVEYLDGVENKAETLRNALRLHRLRNASVDDERLSDKQRAAYAWLRENVGVDETMQYEVAQTVLAQKLSLGKEIVKEMILKPLDRLGYLDVNAYMYHVELSPRPPDDVDKPVLDPPEADDPEDASETLDALAEAGKEAAES